MFIISQLTSNASKIALFTFSSTAFNSSFDIGSKWVTSNLSLSGVTREPAWLTWSPKTSFKASCSKWVAVWFLAEAILTSLLTFDSKASLTFIWPFLTNPMCFIVLLAPFLVSTTSNIASSFSKVPISPAWPPPSA